MTAREDILARIRAVLPGVAEPTESYARIRREYRVSEDVERDKCLELFLERLLDYDTEVLQAADEAAIAPAVDATLHAAGEQRVVMSKDFPEAWVPAGLEVLRDVGLSTAAIEGVEAVLTTCEVAVASTGTIFLAHEGTQGRRVLTLLPDHHVCLVRRDQVVGTVPEAIRRMGDKMARPVTTISGPSATSDIEMTRIRGVHGPRRLTVVLYS